MRYTAIGVARLEGKIRIVNADGSKITADGKNTAGAGGKKVGIVDGWGAAWISSVKLLFCKTVVSDSASTEYYYKTLVSKLINYSESASLCHLKAGGFHEPRDEDLKDANTANTVTPYTHNQEQIKRFYSSKYVTFSVELNVDELKINKEWPENLDVEIHISRKPDAFVLMSESNTVQFKYELHDLELSVKRIQPSKALLKSNRNMLMRQPAIYPFTKWECCEYKLEKQQDYFLTSNLFAGRVPSKTIYLLLEQDQYLGSFTKSPSYLHHYNLKSFKQKINGLDSPFGLEFDWTETKNNEVAYRYIMDALGNSF